ncbi:integrase/transposase [Aurantimonas manganoxydans SI85-9A1]|uniref:Integrase/transposase n=1 Tax=Aurantimonas manganoxydans (strain ATCC BAA-1229 / DSM 21871 / SI85-9A1) TaxID=287752 RepID=Q1YMG1_AURMS|nr:integrase/transposase [Aurantimonas manganoxydans SI85-9A1]
MGPVLHGSAKTTHAVRAELQRSQASSAELARRFGINQKTVRNWRSRALVEDEPMGPKERRSSVLSATEEAAIVALRVQARLPLDDVFVTLRDVIPHLTPSSLHRCLQRHGISRLPKADREKPKRFKVYEIGYIHIDIAELRYEGGKAYLFVPVDRASKLVFARIYRKATKLVAAGFLKALLRAVPYRIPTVLTDNGVQFVQPDKRAEGGPSHMSSEGSATSVASSIGSPSLTTRGPTAKPSGWSARSRRQPSAHSTTLRSTTCDATSGNGCSPTTTPSSSRHYASKRHSRLSNRSASKSRNDSFVGQAMTCRDQTPR